jgi:hypothetical protein
MKTALATLAVAAVALGIIASVGAAPGTSFAVASTLDGKNVLPHRILWLGLPTLPAAKISEVDFLIDGNVRWVEHKPPYVYAGDENGAHRNYLVTSWLSPGEHRFSIRAVAADGRSANDTVTARVLPPPAVPAALAGTWKRDIPNTSGAPKPGSAGNPTDSLTPPGTYTMIIEKRWIKHIQPGKYDQPVSDKTGDGVEYESDYTPGPTTFRVYGAVTRFPFNDALADGGGWWCWEDGPPATYSWSVSGNTLTLAPVGGKDTCAIRGFIWAGTWTRVR